MKTTPTFGFIDEPQFRTTMSRAETVHRLLSYRDRKNGNHKRYIITKTSNGYLVRLRCYNDPTALIITK